MPKEEQKYIMPIEISCRNAYKCLLELRRRKRDIEIAAKTLNESAHVSQKKVMSRSWLAHASALLLSLSAAALRALLSQVPLSHPTSRPPPPNPQPLFSLIDSRASHRCPATSCARRRPASSLPGRAAPPQPASACASGSYR